MGKSMHEEKLRDFKKIQSNMGDLEIYVRDNGVTRNVCILGAHVKPGGSYKCLQSELETRLSVETLTKIARKKGRHFRDEIERSENPDYMMRGMKILTDEFEICLGEKNILDFGCGAGAFAVNLLRLGATNITCIDVDENLLRIAESRLNDYFAGNCTVKQIGYVDGEYRLPFQDSEFDIVWPHAVMEHVFPDQRKFVLEELWRVLKSGGLLIIDATPNRLWIKEDHTSDLFAVNYLPLGIAASLARRFSERVPSDQSIEKLLSRGFRGCTYWEVKKVLHDAVWLNNVFRRKDLSVWMKSWRQASDSAVKRSVKDIFGVLMRVIDPLLSAFRLPQTAFLPWHIMVLQKP